MAAEEQVRLYGKWQTEVWTPPPVSAEGRVPRNEFGNWEVWSPGHVPRGAVHLQLPNVRKAAAHLGVDYVRAVCGFKRERGNVVPAFIGILVAKEMADAVVSTYNNLCALQQHKDAKAKSRRACLRWAKFVRMLRTRARVNQLFDGNHGL